MTTDLALGLSEADAAELSALLEVIEGQQAEISAAQARFTRSLADAEALAEKMATGKTAATKEREMSHRTVGSEIAVALNLSDRTIQRRMGTAAWRVAHLPLVMAAWEAGRLTETHVSAIERASGDLPPEVLGEYDTYAAELASKTTPGRAEERLRHYAERLHPISLTERHKAAVAKRCVTVLPIGNGMSRLQLDAASIVLEGIKDRLDQMATITVDARDQATRRVRKFRAHGVPDVEIDVDDVLTAEDARSKEQMRVDIATDILLTAGPSITPRTLDGHGEFGAIRGTVHVTITGEALTGQDEQAADLAGVGPIDADTAREFAGNCAGFDRLFLDPVSGEVLAVDHYRPNSDLRRRLRARDRHCRFPGCRVPAMRCEHDHTVDRALGGPTCLINLAGMCQRHHTMKQFTPWLVRQIGRGRLEWTSPTGRVYIDEPPPPLVFFTPDDGSPPPF